MNKEKISVPGYVEEILIRLENAGYTTFVVGGCVRDSIIGRPVNDWDITTRAKPETVMQLFEDRKVIATGVQHGTVTVVMGEGESAEVTTFRTDGKYSDGRRPDTVTLCADIEEDLARRDFTMNAVAWSPKRGFVDPYGGTLDIKNGVIRCVGDPVTRFSEDALRLFRAIRFSAQLGFVIESAAGSALSECAQLASRISAERVAAELEKTIMSPRPERAAEMIISGLLSSRVSATADEKAFARISDLPLSRTMRWAAFCACAGIQDNAAFLHTMRLDSETIKCVSSVPADVKLCTAGEIKHLTAKFGDDAVLCLAAKHYVLGQDDALERVYSVMSSGECRNASMLAVGGKDLIELGFEEGRELGIVLRSLLDMVIDAPELNQRELLLRAAKEMI